MIDKRCAAVVSHHPIHCRRFHSRDGSSQPFNQFGELVPTSAWCQSHEAYEINMYAEETQAQHAGRHPKSHRNFFGDAVYRLYADGSRWAAPAEWYRYLARTYPIITTAQRRCDSRPAHLTLRAMCHRARAGDAGRTSAGTHHRGGGSGLLTRRVSEPGHWQEDLTPASSCSPQDFMRIYQVKTADFQGAKTRIVPCRLCQPQPHVLSRCSTRNKACPLPRARWLPPSSMPRKQMRRSRRRFHQHNRSLRFAGPTLPLQP